MISAADATRPISGMLADAVGDAGADFALIFLGYAAD